MAKQEVTRNRRKQHLDVNISRNYKIKIERLQIIIRTHHLASKSPSDKEVMITTKHDRKRAQHTLENPIKAGRTVTLKGNESDEVTSEREHCDATDSLQVTCFFLYAAD